MERYFYLSSLFRGYFYLSSFLGGYFYLVTFLENLLQHWVWVCLCACVRACVRVCVMGFHASQDQS